MRKNLLHIDEIRFFVIHLILINHWMGSVALIMDKVDKSMIDFWFELTSPSLSMISGYLFFYKTREKFDFRKKLNARFHSLIIPYLFWSISFFVLYFLIKMVYLQIFHTAFWYAPVKPITLQNFFLTIANPPLINFWYIQNLILIIPFNYLLYFLLKNKYLFFVFYAAILVIYSFDLVNLYFSPRFLPFYLLGCFFGYNQRYVPQIQLNRVSSFLLVLLLVYIGTASSDQDYSGILTVLRKIVIVIFFLVSIFNVMDSSQKSWVFRYLQKFKDYSFFLFAIHMFLFTVVQRSLLKIGLENHLGNKYNALLFSVVSMLIVLVIALSLGTFLKTRFSKFYYFITGR